MAKFLKTNWFIPLLNPHIEPEIYTYYAQIWQNTLVRHFHFWTSRLSIAPTFLADGVN